MSKKKTKQEIAKILVNKDLDTISDDELLDLILDESIAIDVDKESENNTTFSQRAVDAFVKVVGSWSFIFLFSIFLIFWIILNIYFISIDEFPFVLLNLVLSCVAALQAPIIMMSQNRESERERKRNHNDYKTDLKSELILEALYDKIEAMEKRQNKLITKFENMENFDKK